MTISVRVEVSQSQRSFKIDLDDVGMTEKQWNKLSEKEKREKLQVLVDEENEKPYWVVYDYE